MLCILLTLLILTPLALIAVVDRAIVLVAMRQFKKGKTL